MRSKTVYWINLFALFITIASCTEEIQHTSHSENLLEVDLSGDWNAYGYFDNNGKVIIEVIRIEAGSNGLYTATKLIGDNAVPTGHVTWFGNYTTNPFNVKVYYGDGIRFSTDDRSLKVLNANTLFIEELQLLYVRRTEAYCP